jgi:hypothetical protein
LANEGFLNHKVTDEANSEDGTSIFGHKKIASFASYLDEQDEQAEPFTNEQ